ncbi:MAG: IS1380 family transposase [Gammaproteobacteria bacterium]|nr:IS1380 family transposase [Gammaproteobacteria bacterium]
MRYSKVALRRRVQAEIPFRYEAEGLTSYAGLELIRQYFVKLGLREQIRRCVGARLPEGDYGAVAKVLLVLMLIISGGRRIRHLGYMSTDPVVLRGCGLTRLPTARTVGRWLAGFDAKALDGLAALNESLTLAVIRKAKLRRLTLDVDGSVVSTGLQVEGARRGFNPHRRKVPSYYPISAYEAQTGQVLAVANRPGNVHDGKASVAFIKQLIERLRAQLGCRPILEFRMDGAFFREDVLDVLASDQRIEYAIKVPFYPWLGLKAVIAKRRRWRRVDDTVSYFEHSIKAWGRHRVVIYRKRIYHKSAKNYQLDLFDPDDGYYEYSVVVTNRSVSGLTLWHYMGARGTHEKVYGELKNGFAFDSVPSQRYSANSAWQWFSILAFNLTRGFQRVTSAESRPANRKRRTLWRFDSIHTLRYQCLHRAGLLIRPQGRLTLDVGISQTVKERFMTLYQQLQTA